jgi:PKD domain-containing protein/malectin (di-glucose binding ER protein)
MNMIRNRVALLCALALASAGVVGLATPAQAVQAAQSTVVSAVPQTNTPDVNNGSVTAFAQVGSTMYAGGPFTSVSPHATPGTVYTHNYIFAFNPTTGAIDNTNFLPIVNGEVDTIIPGPAANEVYIGGQFTTVNGVSMRVALLNTTNGSIVSTWKPSAMNALTNKLVYADNMLFVGGTFTTVGGVTHDGLVALNPTTGKVLPYVNLNFTGHHNYNVQCNPGTQTCANAGTGVLSMDVNPAGTEMVVVGNFTSVSGDPRDQVAMIDLGATSATDDENWATDAYTAACFSNAFDSYIRDVQFSPDGSYFVIAATGGSGTNSDGTNSSCDTAARYESNGTGSDVRPTWIDYTGQDSFWTVAISGTAVYLGGHERWTNNSHGYDYAGPGAVPRPGIAALSPISGLALPWNPGRNPRGGGAHALLLTSTGLWVGSDTDYIGNRQYQHDKMAFFPLAGGSTLPADSTPTLPGRVYTAGAPATANNTNVLYRIDAGGPTIPAIDNGPDWQGDTSDPSPYRNTGSNTASYSPITNLNSNVPGTTPSAIFNTERWDPGSAGDGDEMHWAFPVPAGDTVQVRLYFANRYTGTSQVGQRVFNVSVDNTPFLTNFDIVATTGDQTGVMEQDTVTSDGQVTIDFGHITENPLINGIEIVKTGGPTDFSTPVPIYRINAGGEEINATDGTDADWLADDSDTVGTGGPMRSGGNVAFWGEPWSNDGGVVGPTVPSYVPANIFASERWDVQTYNFPVSPGTPVNVNLFMANNCGCTSGVGGRQFNVSIDGNQVLNNYDIVADVGNLVGEMKTYSVVAPSDGEITVAFTDGAANSAVVNGLEIQQTGPTPVLPVTNVDRFSYRQFDGTTAGTEVPLNTGISWGSIRGAFTVNGELIYGKPDGNLYERTFNGSTFGSEVLLDPWNDPYWDNISTGSGQDYQGAESTFGAEIPSVTSMFFTNGRLYYTLEGDPNMHWRWFEPTDGIVGSDEFTVSDGNNWSDVAGAFVSGNTLYYADRASGQLFEIGWTGTQAVTGGATAVDSSQDWASRGIFMLANATNPNQPPVANFTPTCSTTSTSCSLDASASIDPDGEIMNYSWNYGDGSPIDNETGPVVSHDFGNPGKYTVSLTVTDNDGASNTTTQQVVVDETVPVPTFAGASTACGPGTGTCGSSATTNVGVPSGSAQGDTLLMFVSWPTSASITASVPAGWHKLGADSNSPLESDVYYRVETGADVGTTVPVTFSAKTHNSVTLAAYSGADSNTIEAFANAIDSNKTAHVTPTVNVTTDGSLPVSYWADKSATTTAWTPPASVTTRATFYDTGSTYTTSLLADSGSTVNHGSYGGLTATTNAASGKGAEWTIVLAPAGTTNAPPVAAFTPTCVGLSCTFDASASFDPDGTIATYAWTFGDGNSQAASASATAADTYTTAPPYPTFPVTLTVTDNLGATTSITKSVTVSAPVQNIGFGGANTSDGASAAPTVGVPGGAAVGDTMLLFNSYASTTVTATTPAGWTQVATKTGSNLTSTVYEKTVTGGDLGTNVTVGLSASVKDSLTIADYNNVSSSSPIEVSTATTSTGTSHAAPAVASGLTPGTWVVNYWTDKSSTTSAWSPPGSVTQRAVIYGNGSGAVSGLLADSGGAISGTSYPAQTAGTNISSGAAVGWTVGLAAAS